ncbi:Zn(2)-Cys(6) binuclear cluster domain-containing protein [Mycena maculata]|uniref:Zn(2)-Cys(6) binuclear cluster domain-containing protein n=1 Tax=Mycena maculata TaxID=230809 RepID=A0AAD7NID8_9AGAR|nr:Zn(2)-Cys(6) binuclear cluster domain-containing protein [Mycena maculata]
MDSEAQEQGSRPAESSSMVRRHQACYNCRLRKMRCDSRRPICGQCANTVRWEDCEYPDKQGRTRAETLEEDIARVQHRIHQLEHPEEANSSVQLHNPYQPGRNPAQIPGLYQIREIQTPMFSESPSMSQSSASASDSWWASEEPPMHMVETFLDTFLAYAADWGFFLDAPRFRAATLLRLPLGHHSRPAPALLAAVYLAGITLSPAPALRAHERTLLARALSALPASLAGLHPRRALHTLQAELLLAHYFLAAGKFIEGGYHTAAAVSLAVSCGLHRVRSEAPGALRDVIERAERIGACWATVTLDRTWAAALGTQRNWPDTLDTPWPLEPEEYIEEVAEPLSLTVESLLDGEEPFPTTLSPKTLLAMAAILWEQANSLAACWKPNMRIQDSREFFAAFSTLDARITDFRRAAAASAAYWQNPSNRTLLVGCSIAHASAIQLHAPLVTAIPQSNRKCADAATAVLDVIAHADLAGAAYINPIIAPVWATACRIAVDEIRVRQELVTVFERALATMRPFAGSCVLIQYHVEKVQEAYDSI